MNRFDVLMRNMKALLRCHQGRTRLDYMPSYFWLETTNRCNLRCVMCPNGAGMTSDLPKGSMDMPTYESLIERMKLYASSVTLAIGGEPLLHPDICKMIAHAERQGIKTALNTNATLLDRTKSRELLDSGISSISFAFDGFNKPMYESARCGADFAQTLERILYFLRLRKESGQKKPYSVLSILRLNIVDYTEEEKAWFLSLFDGLIDEVRMRDVASWGSYFKDTDKFDIKRHEGIFLPCSRLWSSMSIAWNGDVLPCIYDMNHEYALGNVFEDSFGDIWNNELYRSLRQSMLDGTYLERMPLCENCIVIGTPKIFGIPSGLRLSLADALTNFTGYGAESVLLNILNFVKNEPFTSTRIK